MSPGSAGLSTSLIRTAASVSGTSSPGKAPLPVSISYRTQPNPQCRCVYQQLSHAPALGSCKQPYREIIPTPVIIAGHVLVGDALASTLSAETGSKAFASRKSSTLTAPSGRSFMFNGFRSRWMMPCSCAASRASAICLAMGSASSTESVLARCGPPGWAPRPSP